MLRSGGSMPWRSLAGLCLGLLTLSIAVGHGRPAEAGPWKRASLTGRLGSKAELPVEASLELESDRTQATSHLTATHKVTGTNIAKAPYKVCILTEDFWGLRSAGGTATAYHLLAAVLAQHQAFQVTFLQVTKKHRICEEIVKHNHQPRLILSCLKPRHFQPEVIETFPDEQVSHAVLAWLRERGNKCDVLHGHEWGGAFVDAITAVHYRQLRPGLRFAVEPHGGHIWSLLGEELHHIDTVQLRIDAHERMAHLLNDVEISPTNYMLAYLRQRGWTLPNETLTLPNVLPEVERTDIDAEKQVWRIAFFSRLEERKGIKLFVDAVNLLDTAKFPRFEVFIIGADSVIDSIPSSKWLAAKTANWTSFPKHLRIGVPREDALAVVSAPGMLLVLCSGVDNMPYVVAEAAVKGLPFLTFDAGGALEMFDEQHYNGSIVWQRTAPALASTIAQALEAGTMATVRLADRVAHGRRQWIDWHVGYAKRRADFVKDDQDLIRESRSSTIQPASIINLEASQSALGLWKAVCAVGSGAPEDALLLMPPHFELLQAAKNLQLIAELLLIGRLRGNGVAGLAFGHFMPNGKVAYASSPSWMLYDGKHESCSDTIPMAVSRGVFCENYHGDARIFELYAPWILAMLLGHNNLLVHSYPEILFKAARWTVTGRANCAMDKAPKARLEAHRRAASALFRDADDMMREGLLGSGTRPLMSLTDDLAGLQGHLGWRLGYLPDQSQELHLLEFQNAASMEVLDGSWVCPNGTGQWGPWVRGQQVHPCTHNCCGGASRAAMALQWTSYLHAAGARLELIWEAFTVCGDGVDLHVTFHPLQGSARTLVHHGHEPVPTGSKAHLQRTEQVLDVLPGDRLDFVIDPRANQDCDGVYIAEFRLWSR